MQPRHLNEADLVYWSSFNPRPVLVTGPGEWAADIEPCPAIQTDTVPGDALALEMYQVAWTLDEIELAALANGGTLWLSCWGGLPIHSIHVQGPDAVRVDEPRDV